MKQLLLLAITAAIGFSQPVERVFQFAQLRTLVQFNETATLVRSMTEVRDLTVDTAQRTITLRGDPAQAALGEWLFGRLDREAAAANASTPPIDYRPVTGGDDLVRVFYFQAPMPDADMNKMATVIRTLLEIPQAYVSLAAGVFAARGTQEQMDAARWLFDALNRRKFDPGSTVYRMNDAGGEGTIRLFALAETVSEAELQSTAVAVRTSTRVRRIFSYDPLRAIAMRGTHAQTEQAARLISEPRP